MRIPFLTNRGLLPTVLSGFLAACTAEGPETLPPLDPPDGGITQTPKQKFQKCFPQLTLLIDGGALGSSLYSVNPAKPNSLEVGDPVNNEASVEARLFWNNPLVNATPATLALAARRSNGEKLSNMKDYKDRFPGEADQLGPVLVMTGRVRFLDEGHCDLLDAEWRGTVFDPIASQFGASQIKMAFLTYTTTPEGFSIPDPTFSNEKARIPNPPGVIKHSFSDPEIESQEPKSICGGPCPVVADAKDPTQPLSQEYEMTLLREP